MAKVRLQARSTDDDDDDDTNGTLPTPASASQAEQSKAARYRGAVDVLTKVYKHRGLAGWYQVSPTHFRCSRLNYFDADALCHDPQGMGAQITKAVLSQALLFMLKDQFERYALLLMILFRRITGRR